MTVKKPKFPGVHVPLADHDGNIFAIGARVLRALRLSGEAEATDLVNFRLEIDAADSYTEALSIVQRWVDVS